MTTTPIARGYGCEHGTDWQTLDDPGESAEVCPNEAQVEVDGKMLCAEHAGYIDYGADPEATLETA